MEIVVDARDCQMKMARNLSSLVEALASSVRSGFPVGDQFGDPATNEGPVLHSIIIATVPRLQDAGCGVNGVIGVKN